MDNITFTNASTSQTLTKPARPSLAVENTVDILFITGNLFGIVSIFLNIAFLFAVRFIKDRKTAYFRLIQNLAVADDLAALTFLITQNWPHGPFAYINPKQHYVLANGLSYVFRSLPWMFFTAYLLTLSLLTLNQYVAVCKPWRYSGLMTNRFITWSLTLTWCLSALQLLIPLLIVLTLKNIIDKNEAMKCLYLYSHIEIHIWMGFFVLTIFFNITLNMLVHFKIKQLRKIRRNSCSNMDTLNLQMKHQAFVTLSLILLASIFFRLPFPFMAIVGLNVDYSMGASTVELSNAFAVFLLYINFLVDPIIYLIRTREVRKTYQTYYKLCVKKCGCCCKKKDLDVTPKPQKNLSRGPHMSGMERTDSFELETRNGLI